MDDEIRSAGRWCKIGAAMVVLAFVVETIGWSLVRSPQVTLMGLDGHGLMIAALFLFVGGIVISAVSYALERVLFHIRVLQQKIEVTRKEAA